MLRLKPTELPRQSAQRGRLEPTHSSDQELDARVDESLAEQPLHCVLDKDSDWVRRQIDEELKGNDYEEDRWHTPEGRGRISVDPGRSVVSQLHAGSMVVVCDEMMFESFKRGLAIRPNN